VNAGDCGLAGEWVTERLRWHQSSAQKEVEDARLLASRNRVVSNKVGACCPVYCCNL
jgi:hypothetical protein